MTRTERQRARRRRAIFLCCGPICAAALLVAVAVERPATPTATADVKQEEAPAIAVASVPSPAPSPVCEPQEAAAECLAKMLYGEARGCSTVEQAAVVWCALNRVDDDSGLWPDDIVGVVTQPHQFYGYDPEHPVLPELLAVVEDVLARWEIEDACVGDVGRVLPEEYFYFWGNGHHNYFRQDYEGGLSWDWWLGNPYEE